MINIQDELIRIGFEPNLAYIYTKTACETGVASDEIVGMTKKEFSKHVAEKAFVYDKLKKNKKE